SFSTNSRTVCRTSFSSSFRSESNSTKSTPRNGNMGSLRSRKSVRRHSIRKNADRCQAGPIGRYECQSREGGGPGFLRRGRGLLLESTPLSRLGREARGGNDRAPSRRERA